MRQTKIVLTSIAALVIATPAMAAVGDVITTGASCTINDLGVSSGTANATAQFSVNSYNCAPGTYLPADGIACETCPSGSICSGDTYQYNATTAQGAETCSSLTDGAFPYSATGQYYMYGNEDDGGYLGCYQTVSCPTISAATACDPHADTCAYANSAVTSGNHYINGNSSTRCELDFTCAEGYTKGTPGSAITAPNSNADSYEYKSHNNQNIYPNNTTLNSGEWSATWTGTGTIKGIASCNAVPGNHNDWTWDNNSKPGWTLPANTNLIDNSADASDATRLYCWCKPTSWTPSGGSEQLLSAAWVFNSGLEDASYCANNCANNCANAVDVNAVFRSALFGVVGASSQCVANTIDINWKNENGTVFETGQCTYDSELATPNSHPDKRGYTFTGWKFVSPSQN